MVHGRTVYGIRRCNVLFTDPQRSVYESYTSYRRVIPKSSSCCSLFVITLSSAVAIFQSRLFQIQPFHKTKAKIDHFSDMFRLLSGIDSRVGKGLIVKGCLLGIIFDHCTPIPPGENTNKTPICYQSLNQY